MEEAPAMPQLPAAPADNSSLEAKRQRGEDEVHMWTIKAEAAGYQQQQQQQQGQEVLQQLAGINARLDGINACVDNVRRRGINLRAAAENIALQPLRRELPAAAGGAAAGDLPPEGVFPATWQDACNLTNAQLDTLQTFYGELFVGASVSDRRSAFLEFIK